MWISTVPLYLSPLRNAILTQFTRICPIGRNRNWHDPLPCCRNDRRYCQYFRFIERLYVLRYAKRRAWRREIRVVGGETWFLRAQLRPGLVNYAWNYEKEGHGCPGHRVAQPRLTFYAKIPAPATSPFDIGLYTVSGISMTDKRVWRASGCAVKRKSNDPRGICRICAPFRWTCCQYRCFSRYQFRQCSGIVTVTVR